MKALVVALSMSLTSVAFAAGEPLVEIARCQGTGSDSALELAVYARLSDLQSTTSKQATGTLQLNNTLFGRMLFEQTPMEINTAGLIKVSFENRGERTLLSVDLQNQTGRFSNDAGSGIVLKCGVPSRSSH